MKTLTTSMILSVMFLSAGAFASSNRDAHHPAAVATAETENVTVVTRNAAWPPAGQVSVEPCSRNRCIDI